MHCTRTISVLQYTYKTVV